MSTTTQTAKGFEGLQVAAFESRMAEEMGRLIAHHGGRPLVAPSMREIPLEENSEALAFGERFLQGSFDILILLTGVGLKTLVQVLETRHPRERILEALARVTRVCRGPKPATALRSMGLDPGLVVPEPNTWVELLAVLDAEAPVKGRRVAVQEYGITNFELMQGLRERGAEVTSVPVYRWALPADMEPLRAALRTIADGGVQVALFTNANQVDNVMRVARDAGLDEKVRAALGRAVVASVGPVSSQSLREHGIQVDLEPTHPKMGPLVREASLRCHEILEARRRSAAAPASGSVPASEAPPARGRRREPAPAGAAPGIASATSATTPGTTSAAAAAGEARGDSLFLKACRKEPVPVTPVWLMRQAGRYMREYRQLRSRVSFLELCKNPELVTEVTVHAVEKLGVDAAIIFADLLLPVEAMGLGLAYGKGEGPSIDPPVRTKEDVLALREPDVEETLGYLFEAIRLTRRALRPGIPLLGFAGAPFTLASYMIEGGGSGSYTRTKSFLYRDPGAWHALMERIARVTTAYLNGQIAAGADAVQIFDSWVGCLAPADYREFVLPYTRRIVLGLRPGTPVIHFGTQTGSLLPMIRETGASVIGLDWRVDLIEAWDRLGDVAVMGNLDPAVLFGPKDEIRRRTRELLESVGGRPGHIFNLGHGILPHTPLDGVLTLVEAVHSWEGA